MGVKPFQAHEGAAALLPACRPVDGAPDAQGNADAAAAAAEAGACASLAQQGGEGLNAARVAGTGLQRCSNSSSAGSRVREQVDGECLQQQRPLQPLNAGDEEAQEQEQGQRERENQQPDRPGGGVQEGGAPVYEARSSLNVIGNNRDGCSEQEVKTGASAPGHSTITSLVPVVPALQASPDALEASVVGDASLSTCGGTSRIEPQQVAAMSLSSDVKMGVGWEAKARADVTAGKDGNGFAFFQFSIPQGKRRKRDSSRVPVQGEG